MIWRCYLLGGEVYDEWETLQAALPVVEILVNVERRTVALVAFLDGRPVEIVQFGPQGDTYRDDRVTEDVLMMREVARRKHLEHRG